MVTPVHTDSQIFLREKKGRRGICQRSCSAFIETNDFERVPPTELHSVNYSLSLNDDCDTPKKSSTPVRDVLRRFSIRYKNFKDKVVGSPTSSKDDLQAATNGKCPTPFRRRASMGNKTGISKKPTNNSFVNSQEWTLSRMVPDLRLGILGAVHSGKSALVHRYLTGSYMQDESPEGGRFKKEVIVEGQSYLLMIRDEGGPPEIQFSRWVDAVIFVFSLENEDSFAIVHNYYKKMASARDLSDVPVILVGTQDAISESNPRLIDDQRARRLAVDMKKSTYYETCATYGLNVERVFQDACHKIVQQRLACLTPNNSRPNTPNHSQAIRGYNLQSGQSCNLPGTNSSSSGSSLPTTGGTLATCTTTITTPPSNHLLQNQSPPSKDKDKRRNKPTITDHRQQDTFGIHKMSSIPCQIPSVPPPLTSIPDPPNRPLPPPPPPANYDSRQFAQLQATFESRQQQLPLPPSHVVMHHQVGPPQPIQVKRQERATPSSTPIPNRKNKSKPLSKSNSFNGGQIVASTPPTSMPELKETEASPNATPIPTRKTRNRSFIQAVSDEFDLTPHITPIATPTATPCTTPQFERRFWSSFVNNTPSFDYGGRVSNGCQSRIFQRQISCPPETKQRASVPISGVFRQDKPADGKDLATPNSTPTQSRKNRRRSNIFTQKNKQEDKANGIALGSGRTIPIKEGTLYKKSSKSLNKDWKKKHVTLHDSGILTYYPNVNDYMGNIHGKEIQLVQTTVKIPGMKPRGSRAPATNPHQRLNDLNKLSDKELQINAAKAGLQALREQSSDNVIRIPGESPSVVIPNIPASKRTENTPNVKKRHKRTKTGGSKNDDGAESDGYEFFIVSLDNRQWHFEATTSQERDDWVMAIEQQILSSLQLNDNRKSKGRTGSSSDAESIQLIRSVRGNNKCVDCDAPNPQWASLNLGALICIECSGIHRNFGTHISRVRSLDLDDWPPELIQVMTCIGNYQANLIWESNTKGRTKPNAKSSRDEKEQWIRSKYENKLFLPPLNYDDVPLGQQLMDGVARQNISLVILVLAYCKPDDVNAPYAPTDQRTALHISAALQNPVLVQLLLWYGADPNLQDHDGHNALYYAKSAKSAECITLLETAGSTENRRQQSSSSYNTSMASQAFERLPATNIV